MQPHCQLYLLLHLAPRLAYSLFTLHWERAFLRVNRLLRINGQRAFLRVNRLLRINGERAIFKSVQTIHFTNHWSFLDFRICYTFSIHGKCLWYVWTTLRLVKIPRPSQLDPRIPCHCPCFGHISPYIRRIRCIYNIEFLKSPTTIVSPLLANIHLKHANVFKYMCAALWTAISTTNDNTAML